MAYIHPHRCWFHTSAERSNLLCQWEYLNLFCRALLTHVLSHMCWAHISAHRPNPLGLIVARIIDPQLLDLAAFITNYHLSLKAASLDEYVTLYCRVCSPVYPVVYSLGYSLVYYHYCTPFQSGQLKLVVYMSQQAQIPPLLLHSCGLPCRYYWPSAWTITVTLKSWDVWSRVPNASTQKAGWIIKFVTN